MAAENTKGKVAIPPLATTAYTIKYAKKRKTEEERKVAKRISDNKRSKSRVNLGIAYSRWRGLRDRIGLTSDSAMAFHLLDTYEKFKPTSTPKKSGRKASLAQPPASSISSGSLSEHADAFAGQKVKSEETPLQQMEARCRCYSPDKGCVRPLMVLYRDIHNL